MLYSFKFCGKVSKVRHFFDLSLFLSDVDTQVLKLSDFYRKEALLEWRENTVGLCSVNELHEERRLQRNLKDRKGYEVSFMLSASSVQCLNV